MDKLLLVGFCSQVNNAAVDVICSGVPVPAEERPSRLAVASEGRSVSASARNVGVAAGPDVGPAKTNAADCAESV